MEKQPIDELFRRKLHDAEIAPGYAAWNTLQDKLGNRRVIPIWTYVTIAASLLIVGAFGWWTFASLNKTGTDSIMAQKVISAKKMKPLVESQQLAGVTEENEVTLPVEVKEERAQPKEQTIHKTFADQKIELATTVQESGKYGPTTATDINPAKPDVNIEMARTSLQPTQLEGLPLITLPKDKPKATVLPIAERTLVVSIEAPADVTPKSTQIIPLTENNTLRSSLGSLFSKVKKLKDGEAFALSTTKANKSGRRGLGKFYDNVKESIQNNAADE